MLLRHGEQTLDQENSFQRNSMFKMSRLRYVRGTAQEAKETHQANMVDNKCRPGKRYYSWCNEHAAPGYSCMTSLKNSGMNVSSR